MSQDDELPDSTRLPQLLNILEQVDPSSALFRRVREVLDRSLEIEPPIPKPTARGERKFLTIGMATYDDFDGCYFTIQSIRTYHPEILSDVEFLLIDNNPAGPCAKALKAFENYLPNYRYVPNRAWQSTAVRDLIFREATGDFVLCMDCHVLFPPGVLDRLMEYCRQHPESNDLLQGPLVWDDLNISTHLAPKWWPGELFYGDWEMDARAKDMDSPPFDIPMQGLGVFACRRQAWPGFNPRLAGLGGEEGYIHEKIRRAGGRTLCLPFLRWIHRFERPMGIPFTCTFEDRIRNYLITYNELVWDPAPAIRHLEECVGAEKARPMVHAAQAELSGPFHFFDAIYCINLDRRNDRWEAMQRRFGSLQIARKVRRFVAAYTPLDRQIGRALSHRRIVAEARRQQLETVLVFEDDVRFSPDAADVLTLSLRELKGLQCQILHLGGYHSANSLQNISGCSHLSIPAPIPCAHATAYHHTIYDAILDAVPDNATDVALWLRAHLTIDQFYALGLRASSFVTWPSIAARSENERVFEP